LIVRRRIDRTRLDSRGRDAVILAVAMRATSMVIG
jgi:hypothetical protein